MPFSPPSVIAQGAPATTVLEDAQTKVVLKEPTAVGDTSHTQTINFADIFNDAEGLIYGASSGSTDVVTVSPVSPGDTSFTITAVTEGQVTVTVTADHATNMAVSHTITVKVDNPPQPGTDLVDLSFVLGIDAERTLDASGTLTDSPTPTFSASSGNGEIATVSVDLDGTDLVVTPRFPGRTTITIEGTDSEGQTAESTFDVTVNRNLAPVFDYPDTVSYDWGVGQAVGSVQLATARGGDGQLTYSIAPKLPTGINFDPSTATVTGTPTAAASNRMYVLTVQDSDTDMTADDTDTIEFTINVETEYSVYLYFQPFQNTVLENATRMVYAGITGPTPEGDVTVALGVGDGSTAAIRNSPPVLGTITIPGNQRGGSTTVSTIPTNPAYVPGETLEIEITNASTTSHSSVSLTPGRESVDLQIADSSQNTPPTFSTEPLHLRVPEGVYSDEVRIGQITATDPDNDILFYNLVSSPPATDLFGIDADDGSIYIEPGARIDWSDHRQFRLTVNVNDGFGDGPPVRQNTDIDDTKTVTIDIVNTAEAGEVTLSADTVYAGVEVTATLIDDDGISNISYQWQVETAGVWENVGTNSNTYTPTGGDIGKRLRVRVTYDDIYGTGNRADSDPIQILQMIEVGDGVEERLIIPATTPRVGDTITFEIVGDPIVAAEWFWSYAYDPIDDFADFSEEAIVETPERSSYTLTAVDVGRYIEVEVRYRDNNYQPQFPPQLPILGPYLIGPIAAALPGSTPDTAPTFGSVTTQSVTVVVGQEMSPFGLPVATSGNDGLTYVLSGLPAGLSYDPLHHQIVGTPTTAGTSTTTLTVHDNDDVRTATDTDSVSISVSVVNLFASGTVIAEQNWGIGAGVVQDLPSVDPASGAAVPITYTLTPELPVGLSFEEDKQRIVGVPLSLSPSRDFTYTIADSNGLTQSLTFRTEVAEGPSNTSPFFPDTMIDPIPIMLDMPYRHQLPLALSGNGFITYSMSPNPPQGLEFNRANPVLTGNISFIPNGIWTVTATDEDDSSDSYQFRFQGSTENRPPQLSAQTPENRTLVAGGPDLDIDLAPFFTDHEDDPLTYSASSGMSAAVSTAVSGSTLTLTPTSAASNVVISISARDATTNPGSEPSTSIRVTVLADRQPSWTGVTAPSIVFVAGHADSINLPLVMTGNAGNTDLGVSTYSLHSADGSTDVTNLAPGLMFASNPPRLVATNPAVLATTTYQLRITDADGDNSDLAITVVVQADIVPTGWNRTESLISGLEMTDIGTFLLPRANGGNRASPSSPLTYALLDPDGQPFNVNGLNFVPSEPPELSGTPQVLVPLTTFTLTATDLDGDTITTLIPLNIYPDIQPSWDAVINAPGFQMPSLVSTDNEVVNFPLPTLPVGSQGNTQKGTPRYTLVQLTRNDDAILPAGLEFQTSPPAITGTLNHGADFGPTRFRLRGRDPDGDSAYLEIRVQVYADTTPAFPATPAIDLRFTQGGGENYTQGPYSYAFPTVTDHGNQQFDPMRVVYQVIDTTNSAYNLPTGLSLTPAPDAASAALLTGTPTVTLPRTELALRATDPDGDHASVDFHLEIQADTAPSWEAAPLELSFIQNSAAECDASYVVGYQGENTSCDLPTATGGNTADGPLRYSLWETGGSAPITDIGNGLTFSEGTNPSFSGTPTASTSLTGYVLRATDYDGDSVDLTLDLRIWADIRPNYLPSTVRPDEVFTQSSVFTLTLPQVGSTQSGNVNAGPVRYEIYDTSNNLIFNADGTRNTGSGSFPVGITFTGGTDPRLLGPTTPNPEGQSGPNQVWPRTEYLIRAIDNDGDHDQVSFHIRIREDLFPSFSELTSPTQAQIDNGEANCLATLAFNTCVLVTGKSINLSLPRASGGNTESGTPLTHTPQPAGDFLGLGYNSSFHRLFGTPNVATSTDQTFTVVATDDDQDQAELPIAFRILENTRPEFGATTAPTLSFTQHDAVTTTPLPSPTGGNGNITLRLTHPGSTTSATLPAGLSFDPDTRIISGTPTVFGSFAFDLLATDFDGDTDRLRIPINITEDLMPTFAGSQQSHTVQAGNQISIQIPIPTGTGVGNAPITYSISPDLETWMTFSTTTGLLTGTPPTPQTERLYTFTVSDNDGDTDEFQLRLTITSDTQPDFGTRTVEDQIWHVDQPVVLALPIAEFGETPLVYRLVGTLPAGLRFDANNRAILGTPTEALSTTSFTLRVTDHDEDTAELSFTITVNAQQPPAFPTFSNLPTGCSQTSSPNTVSCSLAENTASDTTIGVPFTATDPNGDTVTYRFGELVGDHTFFNLDRDTGELTTGIADFDFENPGDANSDRTYEFSIVAEDGSAPTVRTDTLAVNITLTDVSEPPGIPSVSVAPVSPTSLLVVWSDPFDTGGGIDSYTVRWKRSTETTYPASSRATNLSTEKYSITGLTGGMTYDVQVLGVNNDGEGNPGSSTVATLDSEPVNVNPIVPGRFFRSLDENSSGGVNVGNPLTATDINTADVLVYSLSGSHANRFDLNTATGQLRTKTTPTQTYDREAPPTEISDDCGLAPVGSKCYRLTLGVSDQKALDGTADPSVDAESDVVVLLRNVNEPPQLSNNLSDTTVRSLLYPHDLLRFDLEPSGGEFFVDDDNPSLNYGWQIPTEYANYVNVRLDETNPNILVITPGTTPPASITEINLVITATDGQTTVPSDSTHPDWAAAQLTLGVLVDQPVVFDAPAQFRGFQRYQIPGPLLVEEGARDQVLSELFGFTQPDTANNRSITWALVSANTNLPAIACYAKTPLNFNSDTQRLENGFWPAGGQDNNAFRISAGNLIYDRDVDFENPSDDGSDNIYSVRLAAYYPDFTGPEGCNGAMLDLELQIVDAEGELTFQGPVAINRTLEAILSDNDGVRMVSYLWERRSGPTAAWEQMSVPANQYLPTSSDNNFQLRVTATYTDADGSGPKTAQTEIITLTDVLSFSATTFELVENTSPPGGVGQIPVGTFTYSEQSGQDVSFSFVGTATSLFSIDGDMLTYIGTGENHESSDNVYTLTVRAINPDNVIKIATITVIIVDSPTPEPPNRISDLTVSPNTEGSLVATWTRPSNPGPSINGYNLRFRKQPTDPWESSPVTFVDSDDQETTVSHTLLDPRTDYTVAVQALSDEGTTDLSPWSSTTANTGNVAPMFSETAPVLRTMEENLSAAQPIGEPISASDLDEDTLTYSMVTGTEFFTIDPSTGQLLTVSGVFYDYETFTAPNKRYSIEIAVDDSFTGGRTTLTGSVELIDSDGPPKPGLTLTNLTGDVGRTALGVMWMVPDTFAAAEDITSVNLRWRPQAEAGQTPAPWTSATGLAPMGALNTSDSSTTHTLSSLSPHTTYEVQAQLVHPDGRGEWSDIAEIATTGAAPEFTEGDTTTRTLAENAAGGVAAGTPVTATDLDRDLLAYRLDTTTGDHAFFEVNPTTGQITARAGQDYNFEETNTFTVTLIVEDEVGETDTITVTINLEDVDEPPGPPVVNTVEVETVNNQVVLTVTWSEPANMGTVITSYQLQSRVRSAGQGPEDDWSAFQTLTVTSTTPLTDRISGLLSNRTYEVRVRAVSAEGRGPWSNIGDTVTEGNRDPSFVSTANTAITLTEAVRGRVAVGTPFSAFDPEGRVLTFTLEDTTAGSGHAAKFEIDGSGQIFTWPTEIYSFEDITQYAITIVITDAENATARLPITITITDVDEPPLPPTNIMFGTPTTADARLTLLVSWTLADNIGRPPVERFETQYRTLVVGQRPDIGWADGPTTPDGTTTTVSIPGLMPGSEYQVRVRGINIEGIGPWSTLTQGNTAPNLPPTFADGEDTVRVLAENSPAEMDVGAPLVATDLDIDASARLTYTLTGADAAAFAIDSVTGQLKTIAGHDYNFEAKEVYTVVVEVFDAFASSAQITVTIRLTDEDGEAPEPPEPPTVAVGVPPRTTLDMTWAEPANPGPEITSYTVRFRRAGTQEPWLETRVTTLSDLSQQYSELIPGNQYEMAVRAHNDEGDGDWSDTTTFATAANNAPVFIDRGAARRVILATAPDEELVGSPISATDLDGDPLSYSIEENTDFEKFDFDPNTGQLTVNNPIPRFQEGEEYSFTVTVSDSFTLPDTLEFGRVEIEVTVAIVEESAPPTFIGSPYSFSIEENLAGPVDIGMVTADDPDVGDQVAYRLEGGETNCRIEGSVQACDHVIEIDSATGQLSYTGDGENFERQPVIEATLFAQDSAGNLAEPAPLMVTVQDTDDPGELRLSSLRPTTSVSTLTARLSDDDILPSGVLGDITWRWERSPPAMVRNWELLSETSSSYEISSDDLGQGIRVTVTYTDRFGEGKQLSVITNAVSSPSAPAAPPALAPPQQDRFLDDSFSVHRDNINRLADLGITRGCNPPTNNQFCPERTLTRAEMATFLVRVAEQSDTFSLRSSQSDWFSDDDGSTHEDSINRLAENRVTVGCNPGGTPSRFCPNDPLTRGELASFLTRTLGLTTEEGGFLDVAGHIHERSILRINAAGITSGCNPPTNNRFCPNRFVTRAEMATLLINGFFS